MTRKPDEKTVSGRWPVAVRDAAGNRVAPGEAASVTSAKAAEFDARFGRLAKETTPAQSE